jgi:hypothetical protein
MDQPPGLEDGELLIDALAVRFSAGMQATIDATPTNSLYRPSVVQRHSYARWVRHSASVGFPIAGPEMIIGVTATRLVVWRTAMIRARPKRFAGAVPLKQIHSAGVHRRVFSSVLTLLFESGTIVGVETLHGRHLRAFATAIPTYSDYRSR